MSRSTTIVLLTTVAMFVAIGFTGAGIRKVDARSLAGVSVPTPGTADKTLFSEYRGVKIGMPATDVRTKLGKAKDESDAQDQA